MVSGDKRFLNKYRRVNKFNYIALFMEHFFSCVFFSNVCM